MSLSNRVSNISESLTLKLNSTAVAMAEEGKKVYNLTAGQLPFRPSTDFSNSIKDELEFLKSFQYSPVSGFPELRQKLLDRFKQTRNISSPSLKSNWDTIITNGGKHSLFNLFQTLLNEGDEVVLLAPYWVSYPEMIKLSGAKSVLVHSDIHDVYTPSVESIKNSLTKKTKAIVINSPSNPAGIHYSKEWMSEFAEMIKDFPDVYIISDEIYFDLFYFDPGPSYFYQEDESLLDRTIIVDGISKSFACTGLRIGYCFGPKNIIKAMGAFQGHTASGANSLVQRGLANFNFSKLDDYLTPIKQHLRENSKILMEAYRDANLSHCWYQSTSAFYYFIDFGHTPVMSKFKKNDDDKTDYSVRICEELLEQRGIACVPGVAFGNANCARISLVLQKETFKEAVSGLMEYMNQS